MSVSAGPQHPLGGFRLPQVQRILPGPAGKLQQLAAAGALDQATPEALGLKECSISTTAVKPCPHDPCFQSAAWNIAQEYVDQHPAGDGLRGQLRSVKMARELSLGKVPKMLVLMGSFQPSGAGSAFSKFKDPTGAIGAALHSSTLKQQPQLGPGCVLLLQNVSVFTPAQATSYLAITANNIMKVWPAGGAQDRMHNALYRPQPEQQQQQQRRSQWQQQQRVASQHGSQQVPAATLSGNASRLPPYQQQQQQQPGLMQGLRTMTQQQLQQGSHNVQQQRPRQAQLPPASPHLPGLIDRSTGRAGTQQQQRLQQGECSPAVSVGSGATIQIEAAAAAAAAAGAGSTGCVTGFARQQQQQQRLSGSMPPPPPRIQPSSLKGQLQKLQQTSQQHQQQQAPPRCGEPTLQQRTWPGVLAPGSGGSCGSMDGDQREFVSQLQLGRQQAGPLPQQLGRQNAPPLLREGPPRGIAGSVAVQRQQQQQQQPCVSGSQLSGSQSIPPALLGRMHGTAAANHGSGTQVQRHQHQQQQQPQRLLAAANSGTIGAGSVHHDNIMGSEGVDDVVACVFGSQLGVSHAAQGLQPTPGVAPAAAAIFGSQVLGTMPPPPPQQATAMGWSKQQQQVQNGAGRQPPNACVIAARTASVDGQGPSQKRFKPSNCTVGGAVTGTAALSPSSASQQGTWAAGLQQQLGQLQKDQAPTVGDASGDGGVFSGLFGFQPSMQPLPPPQQQQQPKARLRSVSAQVGPAKVIAGRPFVHALGKPPVKQANLLDDLLGDDLDDFDI